MCNVCVCALEVLINLVFNFDHAVRFGAVLQSHTVKRFASVLNVPNANFPRIHTYTPQLLDLTHTDTHKEEKRFKCNESHQDVRGGNLNIICVYVPLASTV